LGELPETQESLLLKLRDPADAQSWERFVVLYRPVVWRFARRFGLQHADAEDLAQRVIIAVANSMSGWRKDEQRGTFRGWLLRIAKNQIINVVQRESRYAGRGGTTGIRQLQQRSAPDQDVESLIEDEHRRAVFRWAADEVRPEFHDATWNSFCMTTIQGLSVEETAQSLGKSVASVYAARSRITRRLKERIRDFD
jgi:RNA polymerase sigma-70 factor (ECF subfamily)